MRALRLDDPIPPRLSAALGNLAGATDALATRIGAVEDHPEVTAPALEAVVSATELAPNGQSLSLSVLIAYTQATATDLLRALGVDRDPGNERVGQAAQTATERVTHETVLR